MRFIPGSNSRIRAFKSSTGVSAGSCRTVENVLEHLFDASSFRTRPSTRRRSMFAVSISSTFALDLSPYEKEHCSLDTVGDVSVADRAVDVFVEFWMALSA